GDAVLVDSGGSPMQKLLLAGVTRDALRRVIITHIHTDDVYGLRSLVETLSLLGREAPPRLACREEHEQPLRTLLGVFRQLARPDIFPIVWELVPARERFVLPAVGSFTVSASPNAHGSMPNIAVRLEAPGRLAVAYSSDTGPCDAGADLAHGAHTLIHEATYSGRRTARIGVPSTAAAAGGPTPPGGGRRAVLPPPHAGRPAR